MKKRMLSVVAVISAIIMLTSVFATGAVAATSNARTGVKTAVAYKTAGVPTDADWEKAPKVALDDLNTTGNHNNGQWGKWVPGTDYASAGTMQFLWSEATNSIYVKFTLNNPQAEKSGLSNSYARDGIFYWWDFSNKATAKPDASVQASTGDNTWLNEDKNGDGVVDTTQIKIRTIAAGTHTLTAGNYVGFEAIQIDNHGEDSARVSYTWNRTIHLTQGTDLDWTELGQIYLSSSSLSDNKKDNGSVPFTRKQAPVYQVAGSPTDDDWAKAPEVAFDTFHRGNSWYAAGTYSKPGTMKFLWSPAEAKLYIMFTLNNPNSTWQTLPQFFDEEYENDTLFYWWNFENDTTKPTDYTCEAMERISAGETVVIKKSIDLPKKIEAGDFIGFEAQQNENPQSPAGSRVSYTWSSSLKARCDEEVNWAEFGQLYLSTSKVTDTDRDDGSNATGGNNPGTSDSTIVAIATVGVLAAAAVVVSKRRR